MKLETVVLNRERNVTLRAYLLDTPADYENIDKRPAVLVLPGGAYMRCSNREAEPVAMAFLAEGYNAYILNYSVMEHAEFPHPLEDADQAMALIRQKAEDWNADPGKIASIGFSAGGHLSGAMGTMGKERPNAMILGYPVTTPHKGAGLPYPIPGLCDKVDEHTVPAFLFATYDDQLVPVENTIKMGQALSDHGVPFEMHIFQKGKHGLALAKQFCSAGYQDNINDSVAAWFPLCIKWLETQFHPFPADLENKIPTAQEAGVYSIDVLLDSMWKNEAVRQTVLAMMPKLEDPLYADFARTFYLRKYNEYYPEKLTKAQLLALDDALRAIPVK